MGKAGERVEGYEMYDERLMERKEHEHEVGKKGTRSGVRGRLAMRRGGRREG